MANPLVALNRIQFEYTINGQLRKTRMYCRSQVGGGASGYDIVQRAPLLPIDFHLAADGYWAGVQALYKGANVSFGQALLQVLVSGAWQIQAAFTTSIAPSGTVAPALGTVMITTLRDTAYHRFKQYQAEPDTLAPQKTTNGTDFNANYDTYYASIANITTAPSNAPYWWMRSRSDLYTNSFVSSTIDTDDSYRRARGLA
jgi:hypothetical protein